MPPPASDKPWPSRTEGFCGSPRACGTRPAPLGQMGPKPTLLLPAHLRGPNPTHQNLNMIPVATRTMMMEMVMVTYSWGSTPARQRRGGGV